MLLTEEQIRSGVRQLADEISSHYQRRPLTIVGVLTGSIVLLADLIRLLDMSLKVGLIQARSYRGAGTDPGPLVINADLLSDIRGREVLLVDDIFDTGRTLSELVSQVERLGARTVRCAVLLRKEGRQLVSLEPDFMALEIPDVFVVGYGLDYQDAYRNLRYIAALESHEIREEPGR